MQRRHGSEYICISGIQALKHFPSCDFAESGKPGHIASGIHYRLEPILGHIPRRRGRMDIVSGKPQQVYKQEHNGEM